MKKRAQKEFQKAIRRDKYYSITVIYVKTSMVETKIEKQGKSSKRILNSEGDSDLELVC